jgi:serine/threonine protein kinase
MENLSGVSIGRYQIIEPLGEGGMATVYKAFDNRLEQNVAIKVIRMDRLTDENQDRALKRFKSEAQKTASLTHSNIVPVIDYGEYEDTPYLVMKYVQGETLKNITGRPMDFHEAARILAPIADALGYAHKNHVIHRDVKPSNILIDTNGTPFLTDFGISKMVNTDDPTMSMTSQGMVIGTPDYMAPEQAAGKPIDSRVDIYSLGIVFYELVTGRKPFRADTPMAVLLKQMSEPLPAPTKFVTNLPEEVTHILLKSLSKDPNERYANAEDMAEALKKLTIIPETEIKDSKRLSFKNFLPLILILVLISVIVMTGQLSKIKPGMSPVVAKSTLVISEEPTAEEKMSAENTQSPEISSSGGVADSCQPSPDDHSVLADAQTSFEQLVPGAKLLWYDNFDNNCPNLLYGYSYSASGRASVTNHDGLVDLVAYAPEADGASLQSQGILPGQGMLILFKYSEGTNWWITFVRRDPVYTGTETGITLNKNNGTNFYFGNNQRNLTSDLTDFLVADVYYYYTVQLDIQGNVIQRIWKKTEPSMVKELTYSNPEWGKSTFILNTYDIAYMDLPESTKYELFLDEFAIFEIAE